MKKLISIGVALALLTMAVVPAAVAADYEEPDTYAKVPFAIIQSGLELAGSLLESLGSALDLPEWLDKDLMTEIGGWAGGPLAWTVDMLAWGMSLGADVWDAAASLLGMEDMPIGTILDTVACGLRTCFDDSCAGNFTCPPPEE